MLEYFAKTLIIKKMVMITNGYLNKIPNSPPPNPQKDRRNTIIIRRCILLYKKFAFLFTNYSFVRILNNFLRSA